MRLGQLSMRQELSLFVLGLALISALFFAEWLWRYFEQGLDQAIRSSLLMEARAFEQAYRQNPEAALPHTYSTYFYLDDWRQVPDFYQQQIPLAELAPGQLFLTEYSPRGEGQWRDVRFIQAYHYPLFDGRSLYLISNYDANLMSAEELREFERPWFNSLWLVAGYFLLMLLVVLLYNYRVYCASERLARWAERLSMDTWSEPLPDFRYRELRRIAEQLQAAFARIGALLSQRQQFLRHASHELRTPIAVIRACMELLERMEIPAAVQRPLQRVKRANHSMQQLTETLLWLSRETEQPPAIRSLNLAQVLDEVSEELQYLLQGKAVMVNKHYGVSTERSLAEVPLRIVLSNLLRNAFQYTQEGEVRLVLAADHIVIENQEHLEGGSRHQPGAGLGLLLVEQICQRLQWQVQSEALAAGWRVHLQLPKNGRGGGHV